MSVPIETSSIQAYKWTVAVLADSEIDVAHLEKLSLNEVKRFLRRHGLIWHIYHKLKEKSSLSDLESQLVSQVQPLLKNHVFRSLDQSRELIEVISHLQDNNVLCLPYKGAILSEYLYGDVSRRVYSDIDALIEEKFLSKTISLMKEREYILEKDITSFYMPFFKIINCELNVDYFDENGRRKYHFEPHWQLGIKRLQIDIRLNALKPFLREEIFHCKKLTLFSGEGLFVTSVLANSNREQWQKIKLVYDIHTFLSKKGKALDWALIYRVAREYKFSRLITFAIYYSQELFDSPIPDYVLENEPRSESIIQEIKKTKLINQRIGNKILVGPTATETFFFHWNIRISIATKLKMIAYHLLRMVLPDVEKNPKKRAPN